MSRWLGLMIAALIAAPLLADSRDEAIARGRKALETRAFTPASWSQSAYDNLWKVWGLKEKPADFTSQLLERYGLHEAPYANDGIPMGLRKAGGLLGKGVTSDCLVCHGGSIMGKSYIGLGNSSLDIQALFEDLNKASGRPVKLPFTFTNVRGTSEAGGMGVFLLGLRNPDLTIHAPRIELGLDDQMVEDPPAWWLLKKKRTMYHSGGGNAKSVRSLMQFMMGGLTAPSDFHKAEPHFRDIQAYLHSLVPPKYPFAIDRDLAARGLKIFDKTCAKCHGTYGENGTYPNVIVKLDEIGTDPRRFHGVNETFGAYYNKTWFAKERDTWYSSGYTALPTTGYQAPPLDGIWATAPYLHNGCAPTVYHVLKSDARPKIFTRSYRTDAEAYDPVKLGWKIQILDKPADPALPALEFRKIYDTSRPGRSNTGHVYGDDLSEAERLAVIEYLKTL